MGVRKPSVMVFNINIEWIAEDEIYLATSADIDGLILEAATINEMVESLQDVVPMLLEENGQVENQQRDKPLDFDFHIKSPLSSLAAQSA